MRPTTYHTYTDAELQYIKDHCDDKISDVMAAIEGSTRGTVGNYMRRFRHGEPIRKEYPPRKYYALYRSKTDELVCSGTAKDCAEQLGINIRAFYIMAHKASAGKVKKWDVYVEPYSDENID